MSLVEKTHSIQNNCTKIEYEKTHAHWKRARSALIRERTLELRKWCTTGWVWLVWLDKGCKSESS